MAKYSMQKRIFALSLFFMLIPLVLFTTFNIFTSIRKVEDNYRSSLVFGMKKIGSVMETVFKDVDQASLFALVDPKINHFLQEQFQEETAYESSLEMGAVYNSLNYLKNTNQYIQSIQIEGVNGQGLSNGFFPKSITKEDWERAAQLRGQSLWDVDEEVVTLPRKKEKYIYQSRLLRDFGNTSKTVGVIKIYLNTDAFQELFTNEEADNTSYFIVDTSGEVQYTSIQKNGPDRLEEPIPYEQLISHQGGAFAIERNNSELYAAPYYINQNGWIVYSLSIPAAIQKQLRDSLIQLFVLAVLCFIFCFVIAGSISRRMCRPLENIIKHMKLLEKEQFSTRVEVHGNDEISLLARQFNKMAQKIQSLIEEVYLVNIRKKELELRALQAQVNPHFLYNTLDMIYWTAKVENAPETSDMINSLSNFFRQALSGEDGFTTVENEIEHLRYYVVLRQQSKKPFDFDLNVDHTLLSCRVIKSVLQPLVENAIIHGIRDIDDGKIQVDIFVSGDNIVYTIADNGQGIDVLDMNALLDRTEENNRGFGIKNINDRIQLMYGKKYGIYFENVTGGGAKVTVIQPRKEWSLHGEADDRG